MSGWKSWAAGLGSIASGVALILNAVAADGFSFDALQEGIALLVAGFGILGIAHKVEKAGA